jgi:hypothetical protein
MATSRNKINAVLYTGSGVRAREALPFCQARRKNMLDKIAAARNDCDNPLKPIMVTMTVKE